MGKTTSLKVTFLFIYSALLAGRKIKPAVVATSLCDVGTRHCSQQNIIFENTSTPVGPQGRGYNVFNHNRINPRKSAVKSLSHYVSIEPIKS